MKNHLGGKRKVKITEEHRALKVKRTEENQKVILNELQCKFHEDHQVIVSTECLRQHLDGLMFTLKDIRRELKRANSEENKLRQCEYVQQLLNYQTDNVPIIYMDETNFNLFISRQQGHSISTTLYNRENNIPDVEMDWEARSMQPNDCTPGTRVADETATPGTAAIPSVALPSGRGELSKSWPGDSNVSDSKRVGQPTKLTRNTKNKIRNLEKDKIGIGTRAVAKRLNFSDDYQQSQKTIGRTTKMIDFYVAQIFAVSVVQDDPQAALQRNT
ncbi:hypothetical protein C0J52_22848 [Blattella germanica]|nr:hypothetical protein C0J52_22848 [Blattella germanica]